MPAPKFSTIYDHHEGPQLNNWDETRTKQEFAADADINNIIARYERDRILPGSYAGEPFFADVSGLPDYHQALAFIEEAKQSFEELSPKIRERFNNDPGALLHFLSDEKNRDEAEKLGIIKPREPAPGATPAPVPDPVKP